MKTTRPKPARVPLPRPALLPKGYCGFLSPTEDGWRMDKVVQTVDGKKTYIPGLVIFIKKESEDVYTFTHAPIP